MTTLIGNGLSLTTLTRCGFCDRTVAWTHPEHGGCVGCLVRSLDSTDAALFKAIRRLGPTTMQAVADVVGISLGDVYYRLDLLNELQLVTWEPVKARTLRERRH